MPDHALAYVRKSTVSEGRSLREQESDLRALADRLGLTVVDVVAEEAAAWDADEAPEAPEHRRAAEEAVADAEAALERLDDDRADGLIAGDRYRRQLERLEGRLETARADLDAAGPAPAPSSADTVADRLLAGHLPEDPAALVRLAVHEVTLRPAGKRGERFDPNRVTVALVGGRIIV